MECSASKISCVETGRLPVSPRDVRDMLGLYGEVAFSPAEWRAFIACLKDDRA